ncbi:tetratricopeptide repeat protein [Paludisphaera mucosa]|uniref:Tetratricopeptide repeat protein n=1 Tax=Paludisphaera mucosa TaxID=3030827 RepID=A0ABT6FIZ7_9BACT|nr:tetratricopeptide repeat protein [Paludisphaera mucosa]MDG3007524.1 tetratricopeptide repeat protein [Paludisphaera mucosa]
MARRRPERRPNRPSPAARAGEIPKPAPARRVRWLIGAVGVAVAALGVVFIASRTDLGWLRRRAEAASAKKDWNGALALWRGVNASPAATAATWLEEGRACLALGRAAQGEAALRRATEIDPGAVRAWVLRLEILRVEDRWIDAAALGWRAFEAVAPEDRAAVLRELTLAALADLPDDLARDTLKKWIAADPDDFEAEAALLRRIGSDPRSDDPDQPARQARLEALTAKHPDRPGPREALATLLADGGDVGRGRGVLDAWPPAARDARYDRLRGRWDLEYEGRPEEAAAAFRRALDAAPHDWRTHYRLARALTILGRRDEAAAAARATARIREALDPMTLGPALEDALEKVERPSPRATIAEACARVGLERLARAWRDLPAAAAPGPAQPAAGWGTSRPTP